MVTNIRLYRQKELEFLFNWLQYRETQNFENKNSSRKSLLFLKIMEIIDILSFIVFYCTFLSCTNYMSRDLYQNSIGIVNLQQLLSFSKDFSFLIIMYIFLLLL